ncbi:uncharacterized protein ATC70_001876 [Mucor velutinosus]|uniref:Uncharacterized protein n=1 Tax=Mucor velutinosus TaxID=708070 RepID=A0AAN7DC81_9FUNG|nr:hypothetical protein ATC70_001876 [Mucor velutinosus]
MSSNKDSPLHSDQELANIRQGDDSNPHLNTATFGSNVTDFSEPNHMDSHNQGDHDASGRFNPSGGFPPTHGQHFARQLAPVLGGKHVDQNEADKDPIVDPSVSTTAPALGEKRQDEPDQDRIGLDPSQGKLKLE